MGITKVLTTAHHSATGQLVGGNVPDAFIADPGIVDADGTITIIVREDVYEVSMPARNFCRRYPIERPGQTITEREAC